MENNVTNETNKTCSAAMARIRRRRARARRRKKIMMLSISAVAVLATVFIVWYSADKATAQQAEPVGYTSYTIQHGDTLWNIADEYCPQGKDIRDFICEIEQLNNLGSTKIIAGYHLIVPVYDSAMLIQNNQNK